MKQYDGHYSPGFKVLQIFTLSTLLLLSADNAGAEQPNKTPAQQGPTRNGGLPLNPQINSASPLPPLQLNLKLTGVAVMDEGNSYAFFMDERRGRNVSYRLGDKVEGATVIEISNERVVIEKEGRRQIINVPTESITKIVESGGGEGRGFASETESPALFFENDVTDAGSPADESGAEPPPLFFEPDTEKSAPEANDNFTTGGLPLYEPEKEITEPVPGAPAGDNLFFEPDTNPAAPADPAFSEQNFLQF